MQDIQTREAADLQTNDMGRLAMELHNKAVQGIFVSAMAIKIIFDQGLYKELGFETKDEYAENMLPYGLRTAQMYYRIADKAGNIIGKSLISKELGLLGSGDILNNAKPGFASEEMQNSFDTEDEKSAYRERLMSLGMRKLYTLCNKLRESDLKNLAVYGFCLIERDGTGRTYRLEEIEKMTALQVEDIFKKEKTEAEVKSAAPSFAQWVKDDEDGTRVAYWHYKKMLFVLTEKGTMENSPEILVAVDRLGRVIENHLRGMNQFPDFMAEK